MRIRRIAVSCLLAMGLSASGLQAGPLTGGNFLVQSGGTVYAYATTDSLPTGEIAGVA